MAGYTTHGFHPRSDGLAKRMPARETVAGVAAFRWPISNISLMEGERGTRSLLARVSTCGIQEACIYTIPAEGRIWREQEAT